MLITQERFHNYLFCKRKYFLDIKNLIINKELNLIEYVTKELIENENEQSIPELIKKWTLNQEISQKELQWYLLKAPQNIINLYNKIRFEYLNFFKIFNTSKILELSSSKIIINIPYIAKTGSGAYRGIVFTELETINDIRWSPIHIEQYSLLRYLYLKDHYVNGLSAKLFFIGFNKQKRNYFAYSIKKNLSSKIHNIILNKTIKDINNNIDIPNVPCSYYKCKYYEDCHP